VGIRKPRPGIPPHREGWSRAAVRLRVGARERIPGQRHVARVSGITRLHESKQIDVVPSEAVEVLEEELQLYVGERLVVTFVAHAVTIRPGLDAPTPAADNTASAGPAALPEGPLPDVRG
jgi:hypothetical protein